MRIAVVEDNVSLARGIAYRFEDSGHAVDLVHDGDDADLFLRDDGADIVILDVNLPGTDGLTLLRNLRQRGDQRPVILLTARSETHDRVKGLDAGADDYLVKPFELEELEARVRALTRRIAQPLREALAYGPVSLDLGAREASVDGAALDLPRREVAVLEALMAAAGRVVSKAALMEHVYGVGAEVEDGAIEVTVSRLRKRLAPYGVEIKVRRGLGYALGEAEP